MTSPVLDESGPIWDQLETIPDDGQWAYMGRADVDTSLDRMAQNVNNAIRNRYVIEQARAIISQLPERDYFGQLSLIYQWMKKHFKFVRDPDGVELLHTPEFLIHRIQTRGFVQGDCDDAAQLIATIGKSLGMPAEFHAVSFSPDGVPYTHVYTVLYPMMGSLSSGAVLDTTKPQKFAGMIPQITARKIRSV